MYATLDELKARLNLTKDDADALLEDALRWAQGWIEGHCDRAFEAGSATRYFEVGDVDPDDHRLLLMDADLLSVTALANGDEAGSALTSAQYWLWPRNETPKWGIKLKSDYDWEFDTDCFVAVTGTWGYSTIADGTIKGACLRLAEFHYKSKDASDKTTIYSETAVRERPPAFPGEVLDELEPYRRLR